jgi:acid stress-induced BolA-like protein IbaG/YrbA
MMQCEAVAEIVRASIPESQVEVVDLTGGLDHFQVTVVSPRFEGLSLIERHHLVQGPLRPLVEDGRIHALSMKTFTPEQWRKKLVK